MTARTSHTFQFRASEIADAAQNEAVYHNARIDHWRERRDKALATV